MKYYGGRPAKETGDSLIPYATVKSAASGLEEIVQGHDHGLLMALLAAVLDACAYLALRYFDVVPGCDISKDPASAVYVLGRRGLDAAVSGRILRYQHSFNRETLRPTMGGF